MLEIPMQYQTICPNSLVKIVHVSVRRMPTWSICIAWANILNKSENATLQLSIFYKKVLDKKYLLKLMVEQKLAKIDR